jgi:hypothetical protein
MITKKYLSGVVVIGRGLIANHLWNEGMMIKRDHTPVGDTRDSGVGTFSK